METWVPRLSAGSVADLETFLRGMETCIRWFISLLLSYLETFLRGMETICLPYLVSPTGIP